MLAGRSELRLRDWAKNEMGIPEEAFTRMYGGIKMSWQRAMTFEAFCEARDINRARYLDIYTRAMLKDQFGTALRAIDSVVKLDGLEQPAQLQVTLGAITTPGQGITNTARDQVAQLVNKMKQLAESQMQDDELVEYATEKLQKEVIEVNENGEIEGSYPSHLENWEKKNGKNGKH